VRHDTFHSAWIGDDGTEGFSGSRAGYFPWWSFTKTALAICALRLVEDGRLELDAPRPGKPYTLRQLLQHRAGLPDYGPLKSYHDAVARGDAPWSRDRLLQAVDADRLRCEPGEGWAYSNIGYLFVRDTVEAVTGLPLADALDEFVLKPANATSALLATKPADFKRVWWPALRVYDPGWVYHGCLIGPPMDAAKVLHALFHGDLLQPATFQIMLNRHELGGAPPGRPWTSCGYGLGLMSGQMGVVGRAIGHSGGGPGCVNAVYHFPDVAKPATVAVFTDGNDEGVTEFEAAALSSRSGSFGTVPNT